ncbi:hypothetical protein VE03_04785 [Pseudogymnoascus sp. 23342-1-I1]|nr:hypothetical protein VE03_04785 [Pseudogymnoascus sp. 23342-1-I1]
MRRALGEDVERAEEENKSLGNGKSHEIGKTLFFKVLEALNKQEELIQQLKQQEATREQQPQESIHDLQQEVVDTKEELTQVREQPMAAMRQTNATFSFQHTGIIRQYRTDSFGKWTKKPAECT